MLVVGVGGICDTAVKGIPVTADAEEEEEEEEEEDQNVYRHHFLGSFQYNDVTQY